MNSYKLCWITTSCTHHSYTASLLSLNSDSLIQETNSQHKNQAPAYSFSLPLCSFLPVQFGKSFTLPHLLFQHTNPHTHTHTLACSLLAQDHVNTYYFIIYAAICYLLIGVINQVKKQGTWGMDGKRRKMGVLTWAPQVFPFHGSHAPVFWKFQSSVFMLSGLLLDNGCWVQYPIVNFHLHNGTVFSLFWLVWSTLCLNYSFISFLKKWLT